MILQGIDCIEKYGTLFADKRVGLVTGVSGVNKRLESSIEILHSLFGLSALFSPEHGVRGNAAAGDIVDRYADRQTGLPVYSLYRKDSKRLTPEMLECFDVLVYDIQDIGTRCYTFISTLRYILEDCAKAGKSVVVLDRANPLGGVVCEGTIPDSGYMSFVGAFPLCMRYALTAGELAVMIDNELSLHCDLTVVPCEGWSRNMLFCDTGRIWVMPSQGIPRFETAVLYPGNCLFEGTNLSEGRGTSCPFETIGAPYVDATDITQKMKEKKLPGVLFTPSYFTPTSSKYCGEHCQGIRFHVTDFNAFMPVRTALTLLFLIKELYDSSFSFLPPYIPGHRRLISLLFGSDALLDPAVKLEDIIAQCDSETESFAKRKSFYHHY